MGGALTGLVWLRIGKNIWKLSSGYTVCGLSRSAKLLMVGLLFVCLFDSLCVCFIGD
jgi:hypothetical protein